MGREGLALGGMSGGKETLEGKTGGGIALEQTSEVESPGLWTRRNSGRERIMTELRI